MFINNSCVKKCIRQSHLVVGLRFIIVKGDNKTKQSGASQIEKNLWVSNKFGGNENDEKNIFTNGIGNVYS